MKSIKNSWDWQLHFGKRYLRVDDFVRFCAVAGLQRCSEKELEFYEQKRWMFPVARLIAPPAYAAAFEEALHSTANGFEFDEKYLPFHRLDWAIRYPTRWHQDSDSSDPRHPIDQAWGRVEQLERPKERDFKPWDDYTISIPSSGRKIRQATARHFYHYWQVYELFHTRKLQADMYQDNVPILLPPGQACADLHALYHFFDAVSYFQDLYELRRLQLISRLPSDDSGWITLDQAQQANLRTAAHQYAKDTLEVYRLDEDISYIGLRGMMYLHQSYEESEHSKLAEALKTDIWRVVEFMYYAFGRTDVEIAGRAGRVWGDSQDYLEVLFPNQRKETQERALRLLVSLSEEHNKRAPGYLMSTSEIQELINYIESTDLAWLEYVLVELNDAYFAHHSWQVAEKFLHLKTFASFPESLAKTLITRNSDSTTQNELHNQRSPGMTAAINLVFRNKGSSVLSERDKAGSCSAKDAAEFTSNLSHVAKLIRSASTDDEFVGRNLALATLTRNFTSHLVVEDPQLLEDNQYVQCVRAILTTAYACWKAAKAKAWI